MYFEHSPTFSPATHKGNNIVLSDSFDSHTRSTSKAALVLISGERPRNPSQSGTSLAYRNLH
jgi:hypothetical protein